MAKSTEEHHQLVHRYEAVQERITRACEASQRTPDDVTLLAVSKRHPSAPIAALYEHGHRDFGENYVQEWQEKRDTLAACEGLRWHAIGPLQRNKSKFVAGQIALIHTVHTLALAEALEHRTPTDATQPVLLQVNAAQEESKAGFTSLAQIAEVIDRQWEHLEIKGLMAIPPFGEAAEASRAHFQELRKWRDTLQDTHGHPLPQLSMGMSHDLEIAIEEGATIVRVGTAIFGQRPG